MTKPNKTLLLWALAGFALITVQSCMVGPNYKAPELETNESWMNAEAQQDTVINLRWWELFGDPQLDSLITKGLDQNKDLLQAAARIEEARALLGAAKAEVWPSFGYTGSATRGNVIQGMPSESPYNVFVGGATLNWELDFWGKYRRASQAAKANLLASEYGYRSIQIALISDIASTYFILMDYNNRKDITEQTLETRRASLDIIQSRFDMGIVPEIDLNQAQIQEAIAAANLPAYERFIKKAQLSLSLLLGDLPTNIMLDESMMTQSTTMEVPVGIPSDLLLRRPDVLQSEQLLAAQTARIGVAQAQRFPSISLTGMLGLASTELSTLVSSDAMAWSVGGSLLGPIFEFGKNKRRVEAERFRTEQALHAYEYTVLNAFREVESSLVEVNTYGNELEATQRMVAAAQNAADLSRLRYDKGVTSYLEVLETERSAFDAKLRESELMQQSLNSYVYLYKALGGGWISPEEEEAASQEE